MNYYYNFTTGLIDGLIMNIGNDTYCRNVPDNKHYDYYSRVRKTKVDRNNVTDAILGKKTPIDTYLRLHLHALSQDVIIDDNKGKPIFNYTHEYPTVFPNNINRMLLIFKWIAGTQALTKDVVIITREDLQSLELATDSPSKLKAKFEDLFHKSIVYSTYEDGKWKIKLGSRSLMVGEGPGYINMRIGIPFLEDRIKAYHIVLKESLLTLENK